MAMTSSLITLLAFGTLFSVAYGHGHLFDPLPRGLLAGSEFIEYPVFDARAPRDYIPHFPAGDKNPEPGSGLRSQMAAGKLWTPYEPWRPFFRFRAGPCGDTINGNEHMRGGKYYYGGKITKTYVQGGILSTSVVLAQHHNGFFEFTLCDVTKCGGEISYKCLRNRKTCRKLRRVKDPRCETRWNQFCPPIDPKYPTRWYLPCSQNSIDVFGQGLMRFHLPADMHCTHCVLQWYYVAANWCNPPGIVRFFTSNRSPLWGDCEGQGEARGGYRPWNPCGGTKFPEEYYECADIRILPKSPPKPSVPPPQTSAARRAPAPPAQRKPPQSTRPVPGKRTQPQSRPPAPVETSSPKPTPTAPAHQTPQSKPRAPPRRRRVRPQYRPMGPLRKVVIRHNNKFVTQLWQGGATRVRNARKGRVTFEVYTRRKLRTPLVFLVDGKVVGRLPSPPYILSERAIYGREIEIAAKADGHTLTVYVTM